MLLDVAMGPIYLIEGGMFILIAAVIALVIFGAVKLIKKAVAENKEENK